MNSLRHSRLFSGVARQRPPPNYPGHVPLSAVERIGLAVGSSIAALINPYRHGPFSPCPSTVWDAPHRNSLLSFAFL